MATRKRSTLTPRSLTADEALLAAAEVTHRAKRLAEAREFDLATLWAEAHPGEEVAAVASAPVFEANVLFGDRPLEVAGYGAPTVSEFAITEFATALGLSSVGGKRFIGAALETKHRLPKLWARVMAGEVQVWKARRVTEHTIKLPPHAAAEVDTEIAPIAHTCSFVEIERAATKAAAEADSEQGEEDHASTGPYLRIGLGDAQLNHGHVLVEGLLDLHDALALEAAIKTKAHGLLRDHPTLDLDERRAKSLGLLADTALGAGKDGGGGGGRELVIYTHHDARQTHGIVGVEGVSSTGSTITIEQLAEWCRHANTRVSIRPVLDLSEHLSTDAYTPTARLREQVVLTCPTCVFPGCGKTARGCDLDHIVPWHRGGATDSWNLAPLCRLHHRLKTHGHWAYARSDRTTFVWTSPMGRVYTNDLTHKRRRTY